MITLDGKTLDEFGLTLQPGQINPMSPGTIDMFVTVPGKHGAYDFGAYLQPRYFSLPLVFAKEISRQHLQERIRAFTKLLLDKKGEPRDIKLIFNSEPDKYYTVRYSGNLDVNRLFNLGYFNLPLVAFDPYAYFTESTENFILDSDIIVSISDISLDSQYIYQVNSPQTLKIHNMSYYEVRPTIKIEGSFTALTLSANGESFSFGSQTNKTIEINGDTYTVKVDGVSDLTVMTGEFVELYEGNNDVQINGSNMNFTITFMFKPKYL